MSYLFEGELTANGEGKVYIPALDIGEQKGIMSLEVIAENSFYEPWRSECEVKASRSVTVESVTVSPSSLPQPKVEVTMQEVAPNPSPSTPKRVKPFYFKRR